MGVCNGEEHLPTSLNNILEDTDAELECVVIDDGSRDRTWEILSDYAVQDLRLRPYQVPKGGLTRALIEGCRLVKGKFIARHDVGDESCSNRIALQASALLAHSDTAFVSCWTEYRGPENEVLYVKKGTEFSNQPVEILDLDRQWGVLDGPTHHGSVMFRRSSYEAAGGYRWQFFFAQDWDLWYRLGQTGKFQMLPFIGYIARISVGSISSLYQVQQQQIAAMSKIALECRLSGQSEKDLLEEIASIRPKRALTPAGVRTARSKMNYYIGECLRQNRNTNARKYFVKAIQADLGNWKATVRLLQSYLAG